VGRLCQDVCSSRTNREGELAPILGLGVSRRRPAAVSRHTRVPSVMDGHCENNAASSPPPQRGTIEYSSWPDCSNIRTTMSNERLGASASNFKKRRDVIWLLGGDETLRAAGSVVLAEILKSSSRRTHTALTYFQSSGRSCGASRGEDSIQRLKEVSNRQTSWRSMLLPISGALQSSSRTGGS
jgi:hypothetical protein